MRRGARRAGRRAGRRTARRTTRRVMRRRLRRRVMVGGMVLLAVGGTAAAIKLSQKDAQRIEEHTGASVEELSDEELTGAMKDLGIQSAELTVEDKAALSSSPPVDDELESSPITTSQSSSETYLDELEKLAGLRDRGIITDEEFEAKKKQLLGL
ncbi:MAG: SHOCT domain-containing protein [Anaerolineales bacterium]